MLRLGVALGVHSLRGGVLPKLLQVPITRVSTLSCIQSVYTIPSRMASGGKGSSDGGIKKQKYMMTGKSKAPHIKSGLRKRRLSWLDTPRKIKVNRKRPPVKVMLSHLNNDDRITHHVNLIKKKLERNPEAKPQERWICTLARQGRVSPANAAALTDFMLKNPVKQGKLEKVTYVTLLKMWFKRKDLGRATEVFEAMRTHSKLTDSAYREYAKCLYQHGEVDQAFALLEERENDPKMKGIESLKTLVYFAYAKSIKDGEEALTRFQKKNRATNEMLSFIVGFCLKHGDQDRAAKYFDRLEVRHVNSSFREIKSDEQYDKLMQRYEEIRQKRDELMNKWEDVVRQADDEKQLKRVLMDKRNPKPKLPPLPQIPKRQTKEEFLRENPVKLSTHILRPLVDMEAAGREIPWANKIGNSLRHKHATKSIQNISHQIFLGPDKKRYEDVRNTLKKLGLDYEHLTYIPTPGKKRVKNPPVVVEKKAQVIKKWYKVGGKIAEQE